MVKPLLPVFESFDSNDNAFFNTNEIKNKNDNNNFLENSLNLSKNFMYDKINDDIDLFIEQQQLSIDEPSNFDPGFNFI